MLLPGRGMETPGLAVSGVSVRPRGSEETGRERPWRSPSSAVAPGVVGDAGGQEGRSDEGVGDYPSAGSFVWSP